jgi:hypothetical protein
LCGVGLVADLLVLSVVISYCAQVVPIRGST